jgi:PIN domain nuclease of toxin-antitoxin system
MKFLLDTHLLIWAVGDTGHLSPETNAALSDPQNEIFFSAANICEIAIKANLGRPDFQLDPNLLNRELTRFGYTELPITTAHAVAIFGLPMIHKDPFDRLLVAQATVEGITLLTVDATLAKYPGPIRKV